MCNILIWLKKRKTIESVISMVPLSPFSKKNFFRPKQFSPSPIKICCVTLGKDPTLSGSQFPHLWKGNYTFHFPFHRISLKAT